MPVPQPTASEAGALPEIGRVLTSDRRPEPIGQSTRPTFVVDRARIDAFGARTVVDALQGVPGVELFSYGSFGALVDYGIRGARSVQTLVLVDGIPIADPTTGTTLLGQLSTLGVDRIEIVESGSSTLYGTSAVGGVINVITRVPRGTYLEASSGSFADRDLRLGVGDGRVGASFERHVSTGAYDYPALKYSQSPCVGSFSTAACTFEGGVRTNAFGDQSIGRLSADLPIGAGFRLRGRADDSVVQAGAPGRLDFLAPTATEADATKSALLEIERSSRANTVTLSIGGSQTRRSYNDIVGNNGESDVYTGRTQVSLRDAIAGAHGDAVIGLDVSRDSGSFAFPSSPDFAHPNAPPIPAFGIGASRSQSALYAQLGTSPLPGTRVTAGLRAENDSPYGSVLVPSFGATVGVGNVRLAANLGESFRVPTLQDTYFPGFSNPNLRAERSSNADVTLALDARAGTYSAGYFSRRGANFIVFDSLAGIPVNASRAQIAGLAFTASSRPFAGLVAEASYTDLFRALDTTTGARLPRNPVGAASLSLSRPFARDRYAFGVRWGIVGSDGDDASHLTGPQTGSYDAYDSLDAYVRYRLASDAILSLRGFNLGDARYAPVFGYPAAGRRFYVELSTR